MLCLFVATETDKTFLPINASGVIGNWFAEKDNRGRTELYSLEDFGPRFDTKIVKAYLEGRYGAIPHFKNLDIKKLSRTYFENN